MKVTVLGCGGSGGVPLADGTPGGNWGVCDPSNPRNRRRRVSILVQQEDTNVLIDTSPDLREQIVSFGIERLDAVLFTHAHADQCHGLDELRALAYRARDRAPIQAHMSAATQTVLRGRFGYAFASSRDPGSIYRPILEDHLIEGPFQVGPMTVIPYEQDHGPETTLGFRIGDLGYSTDVVTLEDSAFELLDGVRLWIVDCLRDDPHPTHSHTERTLEWIARLGPERAVLTHMNQQVDYADLAARCPPGVEPGYDGLVVEL